MTRACAAAPSGARAWERSGRFEGDMALDAAQVAELYGPGAGARRGVLPALRWPVRDSTGALVVPVGLLTSCKDKFTDAHIDAINEGLRDFAELVGVVRYAHVTLVDSYFIAFNCSEGCWANVGAYAGGQTINLEPGACTDSTTVQHELMHAFGFLHEHSRPDRDDYVSILTENIIPMYHDQFTRRESATLGVPYDYNSLMHYSTTAFSANGLPTIDARGHAVGEASALSPADIRQFRLVYKCPAGPRQAEDFCSPDCPCAWSEGDCDADSDCADGLVCEAGDGGDEKCVTAAERCSASKPCPEGVGECQDDAGCQGDLVCRGSICATAPTSAAPTAQPSGAPTLQDGSTAAPSPGPSGSLPPSPGSGTASPSPAPTPGPTSPLTPVRDPQPEDTLAPSKAPTKSIQAPSGTDGSGGEPSSPPSAANHVRGAGGSAAALTAAGTASGIAFVVLGAAAAVYYASRRRRRSGSTTADQLAALEL